MGYEALPPELKEKIATLRGKYHPGKTHEVEKIEVTHPAVLTSPTTGRKTLYLQPGTRGFESLDDTESQTLKNELLTYQLRQEHIYQHNYRMGDMLIYDNAQLLHKRDAYKGPRFLKITRVFLSPDRFAIPD
jgi:taurine dioxygenase